MEIEFIHGVDQDWVEIASDEGIGFQCNSGIGTLEPKLNLTSHSNFLSITYHTQFDPLWERHGFYCSWDDTTNRPQTLAELVNIEQYLGLFFGVIGGSTSDSTSDSSDDANMKELFGDEEEDNIDSDSVQFVGVQQGTVGDTGATAHIVNLDEI